MDFILYAVPFFFVLIALELLADHWRGMRNYRVADAINSLSTGVLSTTSGLLTKGVGLVTYAVAWEHLALFALPAERFWVWGLAFVGYDFCYYWLHRFGHERNVLWAAHSVHHQSEDYNLSTALRQTSSGWLFGWVFYLPMAVLGFPPLVFGVVALIDLLYQYWVHTQQIGKLGGFDRWFCAPSNHRVHHAVNDRYLDRNYGGILIVWDRLFGSFVEEDDAEPCVYGTRAPLRSWNPLWANLEVYWALAKDSWHARSWADKLRVWFKPPGWRPADVAARFPKPPFEIRRERYDPPVTRAALAAAALLFVGVLGLTSWFLWNAHTLPLAEQAGWALGILALTWLVGSLTTPRGEGPRAALA